MSYMLYSATSHFFLHALFRALLLFIIFLSIIFHVLSVHFLFYCLCTYLLFIFLINISSLLYTYLDTKFSFSITNFKPEGGTFDSYTFAKPDCDKMTISSIIDTLGNQYANSGGSLTLVGNKYTLKHDNLIFRNGPGNPDKIMKVAFEATWTRP